MITTKLEINEKQSSGYLNKYVWKLPDSSFIKEKIMR